MTTSDVPATGTQPAPPYTMEEARELLLHGWNLRCNRCGSYGAEWMQGERPGWGCLAACPPHRDELRAEHRRHEDALRELRKVNFEQPTARQVTRGHRGAMYR